MRTGSTLRLTTFLLLVAGSMILPATAGDVQLVWDPADRADGYRAYQSTTPGSYPSSPVWEGTATQTTINGLANCTTYYFVTTAFNAGGESGYSNEIQTWARPILNAAGPSSAEQGRRLDVVVSGFNFQSGASVSFSNPGIVVNQVSIDSCTQLTVDITVQASAAPGASNISVTNPSGPAGTGVGLFTVEAAVAPTVASTDPADGASGVSIAVRPTVRFSEAMDPASITSSTVLLLDQADQSVPQSAGSPGLSGDGVLATITPAAELQEGATYRIRVVGGSGGVLDLAGHGMTATFTQANGFDTVADTVAPSIADVAASGITGTSARITWTTNEASDSQVFYRQVGEIGYQQTAVDTTLLTSHDLLLQGLFPNTTYEYHVRSADSAGNGATSSPDETFATLDNPYGYLRFEAEGGDLTSPVGRTGGSGAFGSSWIDTPSGTPTGTASNPAGTAVFGVNIPAGGDWSLWLRMYAPNASSSSWFEAMDGAGRQTVDAVETGTWVWVRGRVYTLTAGLHSLELGGHEARARVDRVLLTDDPNFVPTEQPVDDLTPPQPVTGFEAVPAHTLNDLSWTNPSDNDFVRTVIRYRTDRYPTSPVDGFAAADRSAAPGSQDSFTHAGLTDGVTYYYAAFAIDAKGNVAEAARTSGTPWDSRPPDPPGNLRAN